MNYGAIYFHYSGTICESPDGDSQSYLSGLIGAMKQIPMKMVEFWHFFGLWWGHLFLAGKEVF